MTKLTHNFTKYTSQLKQNFLPLVFKITKLCLHIHISN